MNCPHCSHPWSDHGQEGVAYAQPCHCGCLWRRPSTPPEPLTPRQELVAVICDTMWAAFKVQDAYVDRGMDEIDGVVNMDAVAEAVLEKLETLGLRLSEGELA